MTRKLIIKWGHDSFSSHEKETLVTWWSKIGHHQVAQVQYLENQQPISEFKLVYTEIELYKEIEFRRTDYPNTICSFSGSISPQPLLHLK